MTVRHPIVGLLAWLLVCFVAAAMAATIDLTGPLQENFRPR